MDKPIFIKCNIMLPSRELEYERLQIKKQIEEDGLVVLPPGFELADVDVNLLEQIRTEILKEYPCSNYPKDKRMREEINVALEVIDKYIAELKGE